MRSHGSEKLPAIIIRLGLIPPEFCRTDLANRVDVVHDENNITAVKRSREVIQNEFYRFSEDKVLCP